MRSSYRGGNEEEIRSQIVEVALKHHLVSKFTSLVAVDRTPTAPEGSLPETRALPVRLPHGWTGVWPGPRGTTMPQTATWADASLLIGALLLLIGIAILAVVLRPRDKHHPNTNKY